MKKLALTLALSLALTVTSCGLKPLVALPGEKNLDRETVLALRGRFSEDTDLSDALDHFNDETAKILQTSGNVNYSPISLYYALALAQLGGAEDEGLADLMGFDSSDELAEKLPAVLDDVQAGIYAKAKKNLDEHIFEAHSLEEAKALQEENGGFIKTMWCGSLECELAMKDKAGMSSRCIPFHQEALGETCAICGKKAKHMLYWGVAY